MRKNSSSLLFFFNVQICHNSVIGKLQVAVRLLYTSFKKVCGPFLSEIPVHPGTILITPYLVLSMGDGQELEF